MRKLFSYLIILLFLGGCTGVSQQLTAQPSYELFESITRKKDNSLLYEVRQQIALGNYRRALEGLDKLVSAYPQNVDLVFMRGAIFQLDGQLSPAAADFSRGLQLAPNYKVDAYLELGKIYQSKGDYDQAKVQFENFLARIGPNDLQYETTLARIAQVETAAYLMANPVPFDPMPLPGAVNSAAHHEYFPTLSVDGQRMIFTRRVYRNNEDFYEASKLPNGEWSQPQPIERVNSDFNEAAQTVSADGRLIVFTICGKPNGIGNCDLYYTERKANGWTPVRNMGSQVNSPAWDSHPSLSADGKLLFFSSSRSGGVGKSDLWGSARNDEGEWSPAVNLGRTLNTKGKDEFPFFHPDGQTLYFTSEGHPGMGGMDLFLVRLGTDNRWTEPQNLGYPINTPDEETNIFIDLSGSTALYAKQRNNDGEDPNIDIYTFSPPENIRPRPATYVRASVVDAISKQPLVAEVRLRPTDAEQSPKLETTGTDGSFLIVLPAGRNYALSVELNGYLPYSSQFSLDEGYAPDDPYQLNIELQPTDQVNLPATPIILRNVLFASGSAELLPISFAELDRLANLLTTNPQIKIEIAGHTDNVGTEEDNLQLSEDRARAVYDYLINEAGIVADRMSYIGYGESQPIADNNTSSGRTENRRTAFRVLK